VRKGAAVLVAAVVATAVPAAEAKEFARLVLVGSDHRSLEMRSSAVAGLITGRGAKMHTGGGYLRLFFVGPHDFPAATGRYYPARECVALDWPTYETTCTRIGAPQVGLLRRARSLPRFRAPPTVLAAITYHGAFSGLITTAAALEPEVELAVDRGGRVAPPPPHCYRFSGRWRGPAAAARPRAFRLCPAGVYAGRRLYPLDRGVWDWFRVNVD
jgi:hypothetical protein